MEVGKMKKYETPVINVTEIQQNEMIMASANLTTNAGGLQSNVDKIEITF